MCETLQSEQQKTNCKCRNNDSDYISIIKANCFNRFCLDYSNNKITFCDYAQGWLDKMLKFNKEAYNHYANCKSNMAIFGPMTSIFNLCMSD